MSSFVGNAMAMAQWFTTPDYVNKPEAKEAREDLIGKAYQATEVAVSSDRCVLMRVPGGRMMAQVKTVKGCEIVEFDYVEDGRWVHYNFWFNKSSVADLGQKLRFVKRVSFESILFNGREVE